MAWFTLLLAGLLEIGWAIGLKYTEGFTRLWPSVATLASMLASLLLLASALRTLPLGTAYAIWTGIGAVGTVALGIILFGEPAGAGRLICVGLIVAGIAGLKLLA
ncbi:quaternary ammonium compound efflux SMR transporter SugE [Zoogloea sp.]|uniref:quaternary ammonium compound efflux SMR transporter SugE n=1 Tax=Zoogloea sp. TaxID=49181 RepID=UPI002C08D7E2|nr:quaternary ammonium compound efflux SMR transporter SugE [Zoogloea sp.]HPI59380.1 quaternary ammonium compound efflux SMR transporter SugE [Zoogloea sp.]